MSASLAVPVGRHRPIALGDADAAWLVARGSMDIMMVPMAGDGVAGTGRHVLTVPAGGMAFPLPDIPVDGTLFGGADRIAFRGVAALDGEVRRQSGAALRDGDPDLDLIDHVETWIAALSEVLVGREPAPAALLIEADPGQGVAAGQAVSGHWGAVTWVEPRSGRLRLLGLAELACGAGVSLPLTQRSWAVAEGETVIDCRLTPTALFGGTLWPSFDMFQSF
ncbi:MAG: hypothetical protein HQL41_11980, partial [Alphaproteobacteria bacterium]|nr:hypothetical protein [Alphaproteobacteria bacterium]